MCNTLICGNILTCGNSYDKILNGEIRFEMLKECINEINENKNINNNINTDVIIFSQFLHSDGDFFNELNKINSITNLYYLYFINGYLASLPDNFNSMFQRK